MRIMDWSSDVCSSDLQRACGSRRRDLQGRQAAGAFPRNIARQRGKVFSSRRRHGEFRDRRDILAAAGWTNAMSDADNTDGLDDNFRDKLVALGKAAAGLVPIAGGPLAEIVGAVVPGQRADRKIGRASGRERVCQSV